MLSLPWAMRTEHQAVRSIPHDTTMRAKLVHLGMHAQSYWGTFTGTSGSDGSHAHSFIFKSGSFFGLFSPTERSYQVWLPDGSFYLHNGERILASSRITPQARLARIEPDPQCATSAAHSDSDMRSRPARELVAGYRVITYERETDWESRSISFAPDLDCAILKAHHTASARFGIPIEIFSWTVTSIHRGPPDLRPFLLR